MTDLPWDSPPPNFWDDERRPPSRFGAAWRVVLGVLLILAVPAVIGGGFGLIFWGINNVGKHICVPFAGCH